MPFAAAALLLLSGLVPAVPAGATTEALPRLRGEYLEARTADVYVGNCAGVAHADGTARLAAVGRDAALGSDTPLAIDDGRSAILAWRVEEGRQGGVSLDGLSVVAVVRAERAVGGKATGARSLLLVDATATAEQRVALEALARNAAGSVLGEVVAVEAMPIEFAADASRSLAMLRVGELAELRTRPFNRLDSLCGNETLAASPLSAGVEATPAVTLEHEVDSSVLGPALTARNTRGAFVGTFTR
jgi:hypothetical protein